MKMRLRRLALAVETDAGPVGRELNFTDGLNLLRADNSSGKSTALQAIIYALGLEGMLSASGRIPLPHAMTDRVAVDGREWDVRSSSVELTIENESGQQISVQRWVVSPQFDSHLVRVFGDAESLGWGQRDFFVRRAGAARSDAGFHRFLGDFLGLVIPGVTRLDGSEGPLYLETIFPYFYVEQKHGWASLQARIPNYLGIRDVGKRSAEYVLGLDISERVRLRQRLMSNIKELEARWQSDNEQLSDAARSAKMTIRNPGRRISDSISDENFVPVVYINNEWMNVRSAVGSLTDWLAKQSDIPIPSVGEASEHVAVDLRVAENGLQQVLAVSAGLMEEQSELEAQAQQLELRVDALREDLQRHKDSQTLARFGSGHAHALLADHVCPTCHQELTDGSDITAHAMTVAENIAFIDRQLTTFTASQRDVSRVLDAITARLDGLYRQAEDYRRDIRAAKQTLISAENTPSVSAVRAQLRAEELRETLSDRLSEVEGLRAGLIELQHSWNDQRRRLNDLGAGDLSGSDEQKLTRIEYLVREQLTRYGFTSIHPSDVDINRETYRPVNEGFDLGFDLSASDMIRLIWAYLFSFLIVGRSGGSHLGLLIFDEPRQQETARTSFESLLRTAASEGTAGAQVLFATSEPSASLRAMLSEQIHHLIDLAPGEKLLIPGHDSAEAAG